MDNMSLLHRAGIALCDATVAMNNATALTAVALSQSLDMALVATVEGKAVPFTLRDYAFKPVKAGGKHDGKLRNAQFAAIMAQGFGEENDVPDAVKAGFNRAFPAALYMAAHGGASVFDMEAEASGDGFVLADCYMHHVPLSLAFGCLDGDGALTDNGKVVVERVIAMYSPDTGPELTEAEALAELETRTVNGVDGSFNRRYGLKTVTLTELFKAMGKRAEAEGLIEPKVKRAPRNPEAMASEAIKAFEAFLGDVTGKDGEAKIALNSDGVKALKALKAKLETAIKAVA